MIDINLTKTYWRGWLPIALLCVLAPIQEARSALIITGPSSPVNPGDTITLSIELDAAVTADIDNLALLLTFDSNLVGESATVGSLLPAGSIFNPAGGNLASSFPLTASALPIGVLATWTFRVNGSGQVSAELVTTKIDIVEDDDGIPQTVDVITQDLHSAPFQVTAVPEPSSWLLLIAGLASIVLWRNRPRASLSRT